jgi:Sulfotransferase family
MGRGARQGSALPTVARRVRQAGERARYQVMARADRDFESRLVWLLGSPRSGSTWLMRLLASHEAVIPFNEPQIGTYLSPFMCDLPGMHAQDFDASNFTIRRIQSSAKFQFFSEEFRDVWLPGLGKLMRERFLAHALRYPAEGPLSRTVVAIKEPNGSQSADLIMAALPRSRLLFLLRDGRDVVDSELAANLEGSWVGSVFPGVRGVTAAERLRFVVQSAHKWLWRTSVVQEAYAAHPGPKLLVRYEELRSEPGSELRQILDWLGLDMPEPELRELVERLSFERIPAEARGPKQFSRTAKPGHWRESLSDEEQAAVLEVIAPKLRELGYEA